MSSPSFGELCKLLTHLSNTKGTTKKKEIFSKYINNWRANYGLDLYDGMRMFLPKVRLSFREKKVVHCLFVSWIRESMGSKKIHLLQSWLKL